MNEIENPFERYYLYKKENGQIIDVNEESIKLKEESFELFKELYDCNYGSIEEDNNLISIHTGGWSYNEGLISDFKDTAWWIFNLKIEAKGGHYFFDTDYEEEKKWVVKSQ